MSEEHEDHEMETEGRLDGVPTYEEIMAAKRLTFQDIKDHISGPMVSIVFHVIGLAFLSTIIVFKAPDEGKDIEVREVQVDVKEIEEIPEPPEPEQVEVEVEVEIERPDVTLDDTSVVVEDVAVDAPAADVVIPNILSVKPTNSALVMPALFGMRSGSGRQAALKRHGGTNATERAVLRGLRWLKENQNADGSWGLHRQNDGIPAFTSLALMAFLAHGETPSSVEFGPTVLKAIRKLVDFVGPDASRVPGGYTHGIVMYGLAEAYAVTQIPMLENVVNMGIARIITGMNAKGSFNYSYDNAEQRSDLSVAGWNYQALKAAFAAGSTAPGLEAAIDKAINPGLKTTHCSPGKNGFSYGEAGGPSGTMTAAGTLCLQLLGDGKSVEAKGGLATLESPAHFWIDWRGQDGNIPGWSMYQWYYQTQAIFQGHEGTGSTWKSWNKDFSRELIRRQKSDGRWETPSYEFGEKGGHGESMFEGIDQPVYATSLACLMLTVYYRYLPTFQVAQARPAAAVGEADAAKDEDLGLKLE